MRKRIKYLLVTLLIITFIFTGCSTGKSSTTSTKTTTSSTTTTSTSTSTTDSDGAVISSTSTIAVDKEFTSSDLEVGYDESNAVKVTLNGSSIKASTRKGIKVSDNVITITEKGTYVFTGTLDDGQIIVNAGDKDKVRIIFNGVTINCSNNAPVYIKNADKVFLTLEKDTVNTLTDGTTYVQDKKNTVDGVIFSKADLTINGEGTLNITGNYKHGIAVKNQLTITSGIYNITAVKDDINGNEGVRIKAGTFTLSATNGNGISMKNKEDTKKGFVYICGGDITIKNCVEGIEGTAILVTGGNITLTSQDDGFNSSNGATSASDDFQGGNDANAFENDENCYISISGGKINVNASGDGIDSNGSLYVSGGTIYVSGPTENNNGGLDYNGTAVITGGTIVVAGSSGMAQGFCDSSTQYSLLYNLTSSCEAGTKITLTDSKGNVVATFTPDKEYQSVVISTSKLTKGATYTLTCGDQTKKITLSSVATSNGQSGQMGGPGGQQNGGHQGGQRPGGQNATSSSSNTSSN